jgi:UDP-glucose 4-epimerase
MSNYLVTGVAGFIGSKVSSHLLKNGHNVVGIDNLSTGYIEMIPSGVEFIEGGCHEKKIIAELEGRYFDAILHIAGQSGGEMSYEDPVYDLQSNTQSTLLLLELSRKIGCKKFIYASTVSVYGDLLNPNDIVEQNDLFPKSFYGVGKLASENYLRIYADQFNLNTIALRLFNTYGPGQNLKNFKQGIASIYLAQAITNKHIHIKGSGDRYRDMVYIDDVVEAFCKSIESNVYGYNVYNVCTSVKTKVKSLVNEIMTNLPYSVTSEYSGSTPGDTHGYTGNNDKIKHDLNWAPKVQLRNGVNEMITWALAKKC